MKNSPNGTVIILSSVLEFYQKFKNEKFHQKNEKLLQKKLGEFFITANLKILNSPIIRPNVCIETFQ